MATENLLLNLLEQPFGPYLEETVLSDRCRFVRTKRLLLEDFQLAYNDGPSGFDRTEFDGDSTPLNAAHLSPIPSGSRVLFRGVLSLHALAHLSEKGQRFLIRDFKERVTVSALNGVSLARKYNSLDLESIFVLKAKQKGVPEAERYSIRVLVQGYMHSTASFMRSDLAPDGLLFHTANAAKNRFRIYEIVSMDIETYNLSRTFLFRHHTLRTMRDILKNAGAGVQAHMCTPQWFLENYLLYHAYPSYSKWQRINFMEGEASSGEGSSTASEQVLIHHPANAQTHRLRHLRTVHKNEVWSILVSHSEWILSLVEKHKDLKGKVNTQSWRIFLMQVLQHQQRAVSDEVTGGKWGLRDEQKGSKMDKTSTPIISPLYPPMSKAMPQSKTSRDQKYKKRLSTLKPITSFKASSSRTPITSSQAKDQPDNIYDSDFTQGSLSPTPFYTGAQLPCPADVQSPPPPDPALYALIPYEMFVSPILPANMLWHCPVGRGTCSYIINLYTPSDDNLRLISAVLPEDKINFLLGKEWKSNNEQVYLIFCEMVNAHWEDHLKDLDIKYVRQGDVSTFEWIHSQRHKAWPPQKWKTHREELKSKVKQ